MPINTLIVHNLLINYLNLTKEPTQKQLLTGVQIMFQKILKSPRKTSVPED